MATRHYMSVENQINNGKYLQTLEADDIGYTIYHVDDSLSKTIDYATTRLIHGKTVVL